MLETARNDATLLLTLNRPEKRNALQPILIEKPLAVLAQAKSDAQSRDHCHRGRDELPRGVRLVPSPEPGPGRQGRLHKVAL
jgi:hypothetical protein